MKSFVSRYTVAWTLFLSLCHPTSATTTFLRHQQQQQRRTQTETCGVPTLTGDWERLADYPFALIESHGGFIDTNAFLVVGGYKFPDASIATSDTYILDTTTDTWTQKATYPVADGITHGAMATDVANQRYFLCGGYIGGNPGPATDLCYVYNLSTDTWTPLPSLPSPRGAGGLVYNSVDDSLIFSSGAQRVSVGAQDSVDFGTTWTLNLAVPTWIETGVSPLVGNHVSSVTVTTTTAAERYYMFGGQVAENEADGNLDIVAEYSNGSWTTRANLPQPVGHGNAAAVPYGTCGMLIAGGSVNGELGFFQRMLVLLSDFFGAVTFGLFDFLDFDPTPRRATTAEIAYYDIATDSWTAVIGELESPAKTAVCDIEGDWLYCGLGGTETMYRRQLVAAA